MPRYIITEKAGRFVAGYRNTGVGTVLDIPAVAAEYEITLGTLRAEDQAAAIEAAPEPEPVAVEEPAPVGDVPVEEPVAEEKPAAKKKKR